MAVDLAQAATFANLAARDITALRQVFETIHVESCPTSYNFHMHTVCSDGQLQPEALIQQAIAIGLKGFAITDHHTINGYRAAQDWLNGWQQQYPTKPAPRLWTGVEINANLLGIEVHILGYAFDPQHCSMTSYLLRHAAVEEDYQAERVIASIHAAGGLAVLAHPVRYRRSPEELIPEAARLGIDGVETYYAYDNPNPWRSSVAQTERVKQLSSTYNLLNTCGTDTHGLSLLQRL
ncbi:PHP domain-containing protein [Kovacikia minuta CCNUW1]|uniref:PHP domain-containing protein n=1 Tax=Kovacikia minuta TaxID=2931930 RepID=UPI001CD01681|nr:PHP domain-containing protein [Kovacikia minuta]UBF26112.1 PHP domain-containing protein [Kovacikia minuta CCNUW1]